MSDSSKITLFTPYFTAKTLERQSEFDACLENNVACSEIDKIILLIDDGSSPPVQSEKIQVVRIAGRPTYKQWIEMSRGFIEAGISVLANTDIYFDETLSRIRSILRIPQAFVALSRFEKNGATTAPHPNPHWSQDVWAFHAAMEMHPSLLKSLDIPLGVPRCDNKIAYLFAIHGWSVFNPIHHIRSVHVHETQQRNYDKKADLTVIGGVAYVHPSKDLMTPGKIQIDVWAKNTAAINGIALNKSLDNWSTEKQESQQKLQQMPVIAEAVISKATAPDHALSAEKCIPKVPVMERMEFIHSGKVVFDHLRRFRVYKHNNALLYIDWLLPGSARKLSIAPTSSFQIAGKILPEDIICLFIPPVLDLHPIEIRNGPESPQDLQFWQYPCATEKQAYENHIAIGAGKNIDKNQKIIHTYLGLPWATYIDKKTFPESVIRQFRSRILGYKRLANEHGYELRIHTVCQHIHWQRLVRQYHELGITDLHLSHCEHAIDMRCDGYDFRIHSWPLIAVNVEDKSRSVGLEPNRLINEKRYLASFIGAHMPHYRSDIRVKLFEAAKKDGGDDLLVSLGNEWHFNKIVYQEQVGNRKVEKTDLKKHDSGTKKYNEVLSNSIFSLCPEGAGPNTLRLWESLAIGSIPVIFSDGWVPPEGIRKEDEIGDFCIFCSSEDVGSIFQRLRSIEFNTIAKMRKAGIKAYARYRSLKAF